MPGDEQVAKWLVKEPQDVERGRAVPLGWLWKPRDGVGDQIGYLGLRVARTTRGVNPRRMVI
jgi:hypothetical protein